jgi:hypothetical protein
MYNQEKVGTFYRTCMAQKDLQKGHQTRGVGQGSSRTPTQPRNDGNSKGGTNAIFTCMGPSLTLMRKGKSRPSLHSSQFSTWMHVLALQSHPKSLSSECISTLHTTCASSLYLYVSLGELHRSSCRARRPVAPWPICCHGRVLLFI